MPKPKTWINHPKRNQRVWLSIQDNVWPKKLKSFAEKILELDGSISIRRAAKKADIHRETAGEYLDIMERNDLLMSATAGVPPRKVYLISEGTLLEKLEILIRNRPGCLRDMYRNVCELIGDSLNEIISVLDISTSWTRQPKADRGSGEGTLDMG